MIFPFIRCYQAEVNQPYAFYILSKGDNAGKPGITPWPNSFTVICTSQEHYDFYFWLCHGLWKCGKFKMYHRGSAIQFINIADVRTIMRNAAPQVYSNWDKYQTILTH